MALALGLSGVCFFEDLMTSWEGFLVLYSLTVDSG